MSIYDEQELKEVLLNTDITDAGSIAGSIQYINDNFKKAASKDKYLLALNLFNPKNIDKARKYSICTQDGAKGIALRNLGWIIAAAVTAVLLIIFPDIDSAPDLPFALVWVGIILQFYIMHLKNLWNNMTVNGTVIHPGLLANDKNNVE